MLQELRVRNFLSFRDEAVLSFEATGESAGRGVVEVAPGVRLLRCAIVMGANASGKTNLLLALDFLCNFWRRQPLSVSQEIEVIPFLLDEQSRNEPTEFALTFFVDATKYAYHLKLTPQHVEREELKVYRSSVQPSLLLRRTWQAGQSVVTYGRSVRIGKAERMEITAKCLPNMSFFAARDQVNVLLPEIDKARDWLTTCLPKQVPTDARRDDHVLSLAESGDGAGGKAYLLDFARAADFNISDMQVRHGKVPAPKEIIDILSQQEGIPHAERERLRHEGTVDMRELVFTHRVAAQQGETFYELPARLQSRGTTIALRVEALVYQALQRGMLLHIDEMDTSLHPELMEMVLRRFLDADSRAQLLITVHYDPLLDMAGSLLRKDMFWFTEKAPDGASQLFALVEFNDLHRISSLQRAYRLGRFGALPDIDN